MIDTEELLNRLWKRAEEGYYEDKPAWTEEDTKKLYDILLILGGGENCFYNSPILIDWLKSLKERIGG